MEPKTILIADDDSDLADALAKRCERMGFKTIVVYDGLSTSKTIVERPPDLVCIDLNMPLGNGLDVCRMVARDATLSSIPVIVLTCRTDAETIRCCRAMGAHYVLKSHDVWGRVEPLLHRLLGAETEELGVCGVAGPKCYVPVAADDLDCPPRGVSSIPRTHDSERS